MATTLTVVNSSRAGFDHSGSGTAANTSMNWANSGDELLVITNASGGSLGVTLNYNGVNNTLDGQSVADRVVTVANNKTYVIGPFPTYLFNNSAGSANIALNATSSVVVSVIKKV